jgi:hypothetical protein
MQHTQAGKIILEVEPMPCQWVGFEGTKEKRGLRITPQCQASAQATSITSWSGESLRNALSLSLSLSLSSSLPLTVCVCVCVNEERSTRQELNDCLINELNFRFLQTSKGFSFQCWGLTPGPKAC